MDKKKVLIVEDMALTAIEIKQFLIKIGYCVTAMVSNYNDALKSIQKDKPDIILLDIDLKSEKDGIVLAEAIQERGNIPFIYLTSDTSDETINRAIHTHPSAYLSKPYRLEELKSNLLVALNKNNTDNYLQSVVNGYFYDSISKNIYFHDMPIHLSAQEKLLLELLVDAQDTIIPINIIEDYVWGSNLPTAENTLRNLVYRLRAKLEHLSIETIPSFGYKLLLNG